MWQTPIETCMTPMIGRKKLAIVPVRRAGHGNGQQHPDSRSNCNTSRSCSCEDYRDPVTTRTARIITAKLPEIHDDTNCSYRRPNACQTGGYPQKQPSHFVKKQGGKKKHQIHSVSSAAPERTQTSPRSTSGCDRKTLLRTS